MDANEESAVNPSEPRPDVATVTEAGQPESAENETNILEQSEGCATSSDVILMAILSREDDVYDVRMAKALKRAEKEVRKPRTS
ncbi:hypothetical protein KM043_012549 [Ampulex compressa]|nr:hypothetical protein KM043_012549 [Ampulex compressa]